MDWAWLVSEGLVKGDPTYYSGEEASPEEVNHAIEVAYLAADDVQRRKFVDMAWESGDMDGNKAYWIERGAGKLPTASRSNLTQCGAVMPVSFSLKLAISGSVRPWKATPFSGVTNTEACFELASSVSRIITPALAQAWVFCTLLTLAIIVAGPVSVL